MNHLTSFIAHIRERGAVFRQDFPPELVPIRGGQVIANLAPYVNA
jgi:hypothetical protein